MNRILSYLEGGISSMSHFWYFRELVTIEEMNFNNTLERFYNLGVEGLVRENIQNSLDSKLPEINQPVYVKIKTGVVSDSEIPGIEEVRTHIMHLKAENEYTKETIQHMKDSMRKTKVPYISFEDCNTKGLSGAEHGDEPLKGDTWGAYAYKKGVHNVEDDSILEGSRGGSHGIGKIACNAASDLHMMYFANCDANGKCHIGGTVQLIEHSIQNNNYRSTGYFTQEINGHYYPLENTFDSIFEKNCRGLKIIIPFLRRQFWNEESQNDHDIVRAVCDNFWLAILDKSLIVQVNGTIIDHTTVEKIIKNPDFYEQQNYGEICDNFTPIYISTYLRHLPIDIEIRDKSYGYNFRLYIQYNDHIKHGRMAIVRRIGMKIEDKKIERYVRAPFNAILIPKSIKEDVFLKTLENESHTQLSYQHVKHIELQANAKYFINNINRELQKILNELMKEANPSDGFIDTSELIYSEERNIKKELSKDISTVQLTKGYDSKDKTIVKIKTNSRKNKRKKNDKKELKGLREFIRRTLKQDGLDRDKRRIRYPMYPEAVKRVVSNNHELLMFDFTQVDQYQGERLCNISFVVIDGTGKEAETKFDMESNYLEIYDNNAKKKCKVSENIIKDVSIYEGKVLIKLSMTKNYNNSLKFIYYVEV